MAQTFGYVGQDGEAHDDAEPVEGNPGLRVEIQGEVSYVAAVGDEGDGLVGRQGLGGEQAGQAAFGFGVVGLHEPEAPGRSFSWRGLAGGHLEPAVAA